MGNRGRVVRSLMGIVESGRCVMLGLQGGKTRARILARLQMIFSPGYGCVSGVQLGGSASARTGSACGCYGLACIAHFLNRRASLAANEACDSDQNSNEPQHRSERH
jgi:hypothetical protein